LRDAGVALLGGHTVQDPEIKFGYAVTGVVSPRDVWANAGARPGDVLFLTKPLGTGVVATAIKFDRAPRDVADAAVEVMLALNRTAADALHTLPVGSVHACTDITGFGFVGHASEMAVASGVTARVKAASLPLIPGALALARGNRSGGMKTNEQHFAGAAELPSNLTPELGALLFDPQTSGGLLAAVDPGQADAAQAGFAAAGLTARRIGFVTGRGTAAVVIV
jgi:selenide,water dikinase